MVMRTKEGLAVLPTLPRGIPIGLEVSDLAVRGLAVSDLDDFKELVSTSRVMESLFEGRQEAKAKIAQSSFLGKNKNTPWAVHSLDLQEPNLDPANLVAPGQLSRALPLKRVP